nr:hypothetical protein [Tanacetum cinerariifolium]
MSSAFADTHNVVAILTKSDASKGFDQILDFLNGSYIKYALTVNPHIYVSCIKQFWNTVSVKQSADVTRRSRLPAKLRDFYWIGSYGSLSAKRTSWNEFSSAMASAEQGDVDEEVQGNDNDAAQGADAAISGDDVQDSIPSPTAPTPPPQDIPSTSQVQSPLPQPQSPTPTQPQGADFPMSLL